MSKSDVSSYQRHPVLERPVTTYEVVQYLRNKYPYDGREKKWMSFEELRMGTGFAGQGNGNSGQAIDYWVFDTWSHHQRIAYEIKVSRSDFLKELKNPLKRRAALSISNYFYFVRVKGICK